MAAEAAEAWPAAASEAAGEQTAAFVAADRTLVVAGELESGTPRDADIAVGVAHNSGRHLASVATRPGEVGSALAAGTDQAASCRWSIEIQAGELVAAAAEIVRWVRDSR